MDTRNRILFYIALLVLSIGGIWFTYNFAINFSEYAVTLAYTAIIIGLFDLFDSKVLKKVDTIRELKKGNQAYATFLLAIAVLIHAVATLVG